jgi:hypothetical protein
MSINEAMRPEIQPDEKSRYGSPEIGSLAWEGPMTETDEGRDIQGVVGRTHSGTFKAGFATVYQEHGRTGRVVETGTVYGWQEKSHAEKEHAIFAARREVQNQQSYDRAEPERLGPEHGRRPAEILLARATTPRSDKAELKSPARDTSRSIDR